VQAVFPANGLDVQKFSKLVSDWKERWDRHYIIIIIIIIIIILLLPSLKMKRPWKYWRCVSKLYNLAEGSTQTALRVTCNDANCLLSVMT
jgi:hypothetical protein